MDNQSLNRLMKNYKRRDRELDEVWYQVLAVKDADEPELLAQQLILFNRLAMIYNIEVNSLRMLQRAGEVDKSLPLVYQPFLTNEAETADKLVYLPVEDEEGIKDRLNSVLTKPITLKTK